VGPDELDPKLGYISMDSPMGKALLGKSLDDEFSLQLPERDATFTILDVSYSRIER
ncbi:MAG: GreA/GreB family elongation factor, partial [Gammaproteobacteria bacterium]|nr:GreA/GreB family elongation factor [Gammaproteobacteria bacterium]